MKIKEYEIVEKVTDEENYEYEEMTFEELLEKAELSEEKKTKAMQERFSINMHCLISKETFDNAMETLQDRQTDPRLAQLNAIVFLSLKQKGRGEHFNPISQEQFKQIVDFSTKNNIGIGFDSCSAYKYLLSVKERDNFKQLEMYSEPCESSLFSIFCNVEAKFFPCSFSEGAENWEKGLDLANCDNFSKDIWYHSKTKKFRELLLKTSKNNSLGCRECPLFTI